MTYQLRVAGSPGTRIISATTSVLTPQALDLAERGYVAVLVVHDRPSIGLEIRRRAGSYEVTRFNNSNTPVADLPAWLTQTEADLAHQISRKIPST